MPRVRHPLAAFFDRLLVSLFVVALVVPFVGTWLHWDGVGQLAENRAAQHSRRRRPLWAEASKLSDHFLSFYSDHFGFRNTLIHGANALLFHIAGPANGGSAIVGKDGWYFLHARADDRSFSVENGFFPFTEEELNQWQRVLEQRQAYLAARNIPMIVVIPPDKQSIYPEFFPMTIKGPSRLDQLIDRLQKTKSPVTLIDLRPALLAAKGQGEIYKRTDTHWNDIGAYTGYCEIMAAVGRALPGRKVVPQPMSNFTIVRRLGNGGDIVGLLDLDDQILEHWFTFVPIHPVDFKHIATPPEIHISDVPDGSLPRVLMYRDSFATAAHFSMMAANFSHSYWIWEDRFSDKLDCG